MPLTTLDSVAALVAIDLQKGIVGLETVHSAQEVVGRTARLARAFREQGLPVVFVNVTGMSPGRTETALSGGERPADWAEFVPDLDFQPEDHFLSKQRWGAFIGTSLDEYLRERGVTQIFLTGIATSIGVESTARSAYDYGYNVVTVVDAMTDRSIESHERSVELIFPRLGETTTTEEVLTSLRTNGNANDPL